MDPNNVIPIVITVQNLTKPNEVETHQQYSFHRAS